MAFYETPAATAVDDITIQKTGNKLSVKTVDTAQIAAGAIETAQINDSAILNADINASANIGMEKISFAGWEKIGEITLTETSSNINFSGLDGNTDEEYLITGKIILGSTNVTTGFNFNGGGGSYDTQELRCTNTTPAGARGSALTYARMHTLGSLNTSFCFTARVFTKSSSPRFFLTEFYNKSQVQKTCSEWSNTADNITSIILIATAIDNFLSGSTMSIFKKV